MSDRVCYCGKAFSSPYLLKRHQNSKYGCIATIQYLNSHTSQNNLKEEKRERENTKVCKEFICKFCNKKLASKYSLERHCNTCDKNVVDNNILNNNLSDFIVNIIKQLDKNAVNSNFDLDIKKGDTSIKLTTNNNNINKLITNITDKDNNQENNDLSKNIIKHKINVPDLEYNEINDNITFPTVINKTENNNISNTFSAIMNGSLVNTSNSSLTNNTNTSNTNNNINITNNINYGVPYVYPFGYENINFLTENEVLEILKSKDGAVLVLEKIYSQIENNNFMKFNKKDKHMVYIDKPNNVSYCNDKEFINKLYEQSKLLLQRVFFQYFKRLSTAHQNIVWQNIRLINDTLDKKPMTIEDKYNNLVSKNTNNSENKKEFQKVKKGIESNDNKIVNKNNDVFNTTSNDIKKLTNEINKKILNIDYIKKLWNQLQTDENVSYSDFKNDLNYHRFEDTPRYKLIQKLIETEIEYINKQILSIGDLNDFNTHIETRTNNELKEIRENFTDISDNYIEEITEFLIKKPLEENMKQLQTIKFKNNSKPITQ